MTAYPLVCSLTIFVLMAVLTYKKLHPIVIILLSALLGIVTGYPAAGVTPAVAPEQGGGPFLRPDKRLSKSRISPLDLECAPSAILFIEGFRPRAGWGLPTVEAPRLPEKAVSPS